MRLRLSEHDHRLVRESGIDVAAVDSWDVALLGAPRIASATTSGPHGRTLLALNLSYGEQDAPPTVELQNFVPGAVRSTGLVPDDDADGTRRYLAAEAIRLTAVRSLEIAAGNASSTSMPLGERILEREAAMTTSHEATLIIDGEAHPAGEVSFGRHVGYWCSQGDDGMALVVYCWGVGAPLRLVTASRIGT